MKTRNRTSSAFTRMKPCRVGEWGDELYRHLVLLRQKSCTELKFIDDEVGLRQFAALIRDTGERAAAAHCIRMCVLMAQWYKHHPNGRLAEGARILCMQLLADRRVVGEVSADADADGDGDGTVE